MIGEREPEAVVNVRDLIRDRGVTITGPLCTGPLVVVQGSMDKAVADYAVQQLQHMLKSVVVEATSSGAPATQKRIRTGATFR
jgi:type II secretory pathway predicted ATPase ExeA